MSCIMVRTGQDRTETRKKTFHALIMYVHVHSYDLHYNVLWGYSSELKGLTKKLPFSILPRKKDASMQNCKSVVAVVFLYYFL